MLFYVFPLFREGIFLTHDGENHMARIAAFSSSAIDGQFPVRWAGELNYSYGSPVFIFFYPLPYIFSFLFQVIGFDIVNSFKIILFLSFIISGGTFYLFIKNFVRNEVALFGSVLYLITPYHLLNLYVRGDVGELLAYMLIPLIFYSIESFRKKPDILKLLLGSISYSLLVLSHNGVSLLFSPVILLYIFIFIQKIKIRIVGMSIIPVGLAISAFFWIPALIESKYTNAKLFVGDFFQNNFIPSLFDLIHSPWGFGADINSPDGLAPQFGIFYFALLLISFFLLYKYQGDIKKILFWGGILIVGILLALSVSEIIWRNFSILKLFQFPWRMIVLATFSGVVLISLGFNKLKNRKITIVALLMVILSTISFIKTREYTNYPDNFYYSFPGTTYYHGEATTIWSAGDAYEKPKKSVEIIEGQGNITNIEKTSKSHTFKVIADSEMNIVDNTHYFPGWNAYINGSVTEIQFQDPEYRGLITFKIPPGEHDIEVRFENTRIRFFSNLISLCMVGILILLVFKRKVVNRIIK